MICRLLSIIFLRYQKFLGKQNLSCTKIFVSVLWDKRKSMKSWRPPPSFAWQFSIKEFFWNATVFSNEIFRNCQTKFFRRKNLKPPIMNKIFRCPKFSKTFKGCPRIFSALWDPNFSTKSVIPFSSTKLFETRNFLKNRRIPLRNFSTLWDMKILTENRDMRPPTHKSLSIPEFFWKTEGFLYKQFPFGPVKQMILAKPWCPPPSYAWKF